MAKYAGVGTMTVSRALRTPGRVSDKLRKKIQIAIDVLGYKPNVAASLLASASANPVIAVITTKIHDHSAQILLDALQASLTKQGYTILLFYVENDAIIENINLKKMIPIMNIGKQDDISADAYVGLDNSLAMYMLTEHIIKKVIKILDYSVLAIKIFFFNNVYMAGIKQC